MEVKSLAHSLLVCHGTSCIRMNLFLTPNSINELLCLNEVRNHYCSFREKSSSASEFYYRTSSVPCRLIHENSFQKPMSKDAEQSFQRLLIHFKSLFLNMELMPIKWPEKLYFILRKNSQVYASIALRYGFHLKLPKNVSFRQLISN